MAWAITAAVVMGGLTANSIQQQNKALTQQQQALVDAANLNMKMEQQKEADRIAQTGMELTQEERVKFAEQGSMRAAAAESGVAGVSPLRNLTNIYVQHSLTKGSIITNQEMDLYTSSMGNINTYAQTQSGINQAQSQKTTGFEALAQIGMSAAGGYMAAGGTFGGGAAAGNTAGLKAGASTGAAAWSPTFNSAYNSAYASASAGFGSKELGYAFLSSSQKRK
jgi:hypothetical protein